MMMSTQCSNHVEAYNKLIIKRDFFALSCLITKIKCNIESVSVISRGRNSQILPLVFERCLQQL